MNFITTQDRFQISLSSLEDKISVDNPVSFVDAFVEHLDLRRSWGFRSTKLSATTELDTKHKASFNH